VQYTPSGTIPDEAVLRELDAITEADIERGIAQDPDAAPILDEAWFAKARRVEPEKEVISIRLDKDILEFFRSKGPKYQTRINAVLRAFVDHERG
jgi:uncharacterized protein (DUF4415 family)